MGDQYEDIKSVMAKITNKVILHYDIKDLSKNILLALREEGIDYKLSNFGNANTYGSVPHQRY